ncbi:NucA/NucB deoxyribonuclease domain-containing protein [Streptomyces lavendulocolor]|uniref:NucA/NucB deoxyribonuclease domain-containing protein n=1 Tax=Streptomyces lavendulocolor TaxID=67316 RepID=UPI003C2C06D6
MKSVQNIGGVGAAALAITGTLMVPAQAAQPTPLDELSISVKIAAPTGPSARAVSCQINRVVYNRFEACAVADATVTLLRNGRPVGNAKFKITNRMTLQHKKLKWSEATSISKATLVNASGIRASLAVSCAGKCKATSSFPVGRTLGSSAINGSVGYTSSVQKNKHDATAAKYTFTFTKPGFTPGVISYSSLKFRCDDTFWNKANTARTLSPGCVFPSFTSTMTTMQSLPGISQNIKNVQSRGRKLGAPGGAVIRREAREAKIQANRNAVCPSSQRPPSPGLSCDEYPFASTLEGGVNVPANSRGTAWVPIDEQRKQGGRIQTFHKKERILHGDGFWVKV